MAKHLNMASLIVIVVTFILFTVALFVKGFTHDLLLEAGVLLVSIKLIMMGYKNSVDSKQIKQDLEEIKQMINDAGGRLAGE